MKTAKQTRRGFLKNAFICGSAAVFPNLVPASTLGLGGHVAANSRINLAMIGTGRQVFYANLPWFLWSKDIQVVAVCDVDAWRMDQARQAVEASYASAMGSGTYNGCAMIRDYREVLARKDVDAVMISTPDYWHAHMAIAAANAGKDIALEKPISLTVAEGRAIARAVERNGCVFRTDTEVRACKPFHQICQVVRNGCIGQVRRVLAGVPKEPLLLAEQPTTMPMPPELDYDLWLGPSPAKRYTEQRVHCRQAGLDYVGGKGPGWFHISDYTLGVILNWGAHILDITQWALNTERGGPVEVSGSGRFPKDCLWDVLQEFKVRYRYANGIEVIYTDGGEPYVRVEGSEGWIEYTWFKDNSFKASRPSLLTWKPGPNDVTLPCVGEKEDFVSCIRSRKETIIPAEIGHRTATMCQIGYIAAKLGRRLKWDTAAETFVGNDMANALLDRTYRAPWGLTV
jgi:predicted dehydrogenase